MKQIEREWERYLAGDLKGATEDQIKLAKKSFFIGASASFYGVMGTMESGKSREERANVLQSMDQELEEFCQEYHQELEKRLRHIPRA